jgi:GNAT superfamily N-acetyltransferase
VFERMPKPGRLISQWGYIANVFVLAGYRDQGVGGQLLSAAIDHAKANGYARLVLSPTERAVPFYRRAGFGAADELLLLPL